MSPIRVALVGLSASSTTSWAGDAHLPYLLSERGRAKYELVALLNSSAERAQAAKLQFNLPPTVKAYGSPQQLADDPDVDLVVVSTRLDVHYDSALPSVRAGKAVYIEWPLAQSLSHAQELRDMSADPKASLIGLQSRVSPIMVKVKQLLTQGTIGTVLSSSVHAFSKFRARDTTAENLAYLAERKVSGTSANISFGHMIDAVHDILGEFRSFNSLLQIERPSIAVLGSDGNKTGSMTTDVADHLSAAGSLEQGSVTAQIAHNAPLTVLHRNGGPFPGMPGFTWIIVGESGEIRICGPSAYLQMDDLLGPVTIEHHDFASDEVHKIAWDWHDWQKELPGKARNVAELYERFAAWKLNGQDSSVASLPEQARWPSLDDAVRRHRQISDMYEAWDAVRTA